MQGFNSLNPLQGQVLYPPEGFIKPKIPEVIGEIVWGLQPGQVAATPSIVNNITSICGLVKVCLVPVQCVDPRGIEPLQATLTESLPNLVGPRTMLIMIQNIKINQYGELLTLINPEAIRDFLVLGKGQVLQGHSVLCPKPLCHSEPSRGIFGTM